MGDGVLDLATYTYIGGACGDRLKYSLKALTRQETLRTSAQLRSLFPEDRQPFECSAVATTRYTRWSWYNSKQIAIPFVGTHWGTKASPLEVHVKGR